MIEVVHAEGVLKTVGGVRALDGLNLAVRKGETHGLLGTTGAGRSTALRVLLGLVRPEAGTVRLLARDPWKAPFRIRRRLGYVPSDAALWPNLSGGEIIDLLSRLRGTTDTEHRDRLIERFGLDPTRKARAYSPSERQKTLLVAAFTARVELLLLDEPTRHLDERASTVLRQCLEREREAGTTILMTSDRVAEMRDLCDRVTLLNAGRVAGTGAVSDFPGLTHSSVTAWLASVSDEITYPDSVRNLEVLGNRLRCQVASDDVEALMFKLCEQGLKDVDIRPVSLGEFLFGLSRTEGTPTVEAA